MRAPLSQTAAGRAVASAHTIQVESLIRYAFELVPGDRQAQIDAHQIGLAFVRSEARAFECDIPWSVSAEWPDGIAKAGRHLSEISIRRRHESDDYHQTGVVGEFTDADWEAFVAFSPYAFDGTVWGEGGSRLAHFSDSGTALDIWLTQEQKAQFADLMPSADLRPLLTRRQRRHMRGAP